MQRCLFVSRAVLFLVQWCMLCVAVFVASRIIQNGMYQFEGLLAAAIFGETCSVGYCAAVSTACVKRYTHAHTLKVGRDFLISHLFL